MKFSYFKFPLTRNSEFFGSTILRPIIPIRIVAGSQSTTYAALLDSGADFCVFDGEIGEYLGLDVPSGNKEIFGGVQERSGVEAFFHEVTIIVGGWDYKVTVGFSYDIAKYGYGILGQKGFFDKFIVKFDLTKEEIELNQRKK